MLSAPAHQAGRADAAGRGTHGPDGAAPLRVLMVCTGNICRSTMAHQVLDEAIAAAGLSGRVRVDSAGVSDEEHGNPIDPRAARVLREAGHSIPDHRARQIRASEIGQWDLILTMTGRHYAAVQRLARRAGIADEAPAGAGREVAAGVDAFSAGPVGQGRGRAGADAGDPVGCSDDGPGTATRSSRDPGAPGRPARRIRMFRDFDPQSGPGDMDLPDPWYGGHEDFLDTLAVIERTTPRIVSYLRGL
ncbi:low molecular weight protein-tyrosine-phosphatase [Actinomyces sp. B33]|uniref:low molecular weight protein-tyrosine-phosphatase n=1 Tax=Actinomyces sp. B33 TaxID=2942131 RepID=UPI003FA44E9C